MPPISPKFLVKALLNFIIKLNIQENQVVKNNEDHNSFVFSLNIHCQNNKNITFFSAKTCTFFTSEKLLLLGL